MPPSVAVLDDDEAVRAVVTLLLGDEGYRVLPLWRGEGALEALKATPLSGLILDLRLRSAIGGWEVLAQLERERTLRGVPVLVYSAAEEELRDKGPSLLARGYSVLTKPFELDDLVRWVREHVGTQPARGG